jgi:hypothetical protein
MSTVTQRRRALSDYLPFIRQKPPAAPKLIDGIEELERAYQVMSLISDLEPSSQARIIDHVERICIENAQRIHDFETARPPQPTTRPAVEP